ncbi:MAG TPA: Holliday junction branch migration protein RuvA [Candidatus Paceibacterota bacterium]
MIERIAGIAIDTDFTSKISIETPSGLTYGVFCTKETALSTIPSNIYLYTHLVIKDDAHELYGFIDGFERTVFKKLMSVSGLGPKSALSILSNLGVSGLLRALIGKDAAMLAKTPGIGKKTAEKTIIELYSFAEDHQEAITNTVTNPLYHEAFEALVSLGYEEALVKEVLTNMSIDDSMTLSLVMREGMKNLAKNMR